MAACGIAPEDDDANSAVKQSFPSLPKPTPKPVPVAPVVATPKPVEPQPTEQPAPPKMQGKADQWQLKISMDAGSDFAGWVQAVKDATVFMLEMAQTKEDTMNIFRTNRNIFDKMQADDVNSYEELTKIFKTYKEKL